MVCAGSCQRTTRPFCRYPRPPGMFPLAIKAHNTRPFSDNAFHLLLLPLLLSHNCFYPLQLHLHYHAFYFAPICVQVCPFSCCFFVSWGNHCVCLHSVFYTTDMAPDIPIHLRRFLLSFHYRVTRIFWIAILLQPQVALSAVIGAAANYYICPLCCI